jgi:copper homeostasis protein
LATGALTHDHRIDTVFIEKVREAADGMPIIFHRAFDLVADKLSALDSLIELGVVRVLTSGGAASAPEGAPCLAGLIEHAGDSIEILPGGGIRASNAPGLVMSTGSGWIHGSFSRTGGDGLPAFDPAEMLALLRALGRDGQEPPQIFP